MELVYFRGLNCHLASIVSMANALGVRYTDAFAELWSETDFTDETLYNIYVSKRVFTGLRSIGVQIEMLDCGEERIRESVSRISDGELFLIGMDTYAIPWHPVSGHFHDRHYFFAQRETEHSVVGFDPIYGEKGARMDMAAVLSGTYELGRVFRAEASPQEGVLKREAEAVLRVHPETEHKIFEKIIECKGEGKSGLHDLIKRITAMINNRYMFRRYWESVADIFGEDARIFDEPFFMRWEAVRNGLYKGLILKDNRRVIDEVCGLFAGLVCEEMDIARRIIGMARR